MSVNAIQLFIQTTLDGLQPPGNAIGPIQAWVLPPIQTDIGFNPAVFIWGGTLDEQRATIPRPSAQKRILHTISLYVMYISEHDPALVQQFPVLLDYIRTVIRAIPLPVQLSDPTTGEQSEIHDIGERIQITYSTPVAMVSTEGMLQHNAAVRLPMYEWLNPA